MKKILRDVVLLSLCFVVLLSSGCNKKRMKGLVPAQGVVTLNGELNFSTIGVDAEEPDQFITSGWYAWQRNASPESVFKAPAYYTVYLPDASTELKLKKTDDYPYNAEATVWAETSDRSTYQVGVDYTIRNLTSGNSRRFDGSLVSLYGTYDGITRYTRQGASSSGVAGSSVAALEIDRSKPWNNCNHECDICTHTHCPNNQSRRN